MVIPPLPRIPNINSIHMRNLFATLICLVSVLTFNEIQAQPWTYNVGTGGGTAANNTNAGSGNTALFPTTPSGGGTYRVRIGTGGGSLAFADPGTSLGSGNEIQLNAATGTSTNKYSIYGWTSPSSVAYFKSNVRTTSGSNGVIVMHIGNGGTTVFGDNASYTSYNVSLAILRITYASGNISTVERRITGSFTAVAGSGIAKDTDQLFEFYCNNSSSTTDYSRSGSNTLNAQSWDLWVAGTKVSPSGGWPSAGTLAANSTLAGLAFFAEGNSAVPANSAYLYMDDLESSTHFQFVVLHQLKQVIYPLQL